MLHALWVLGIPASAAALRARRVSADLQRLYQLTLVVLVFSFLLQALSWVHPGPGGLVVPFGLTTWVTRPDDDTEIRITTTKANRYTVTLRGAFQLVWEPRDGFEKWMFILFVRRLQRVATSTPCLTQAQVAEAFGSSQTYVSRWEDLVVEHGWHVLSDRFRHALHTFLPDAERSRAILQVWVPAFWLSAWEVRERLIQLGVLPNREALPVEALHALAQHTGFNRVRDLLLERLDLQGGRLIAKETWWLPELIALNERLISKLERGERLTPSERADMEPLRLPTPEKQGDSESPPLGAALHSALFGRPPETVTSPAPVRCTYCHSDDTAPKSKQPRLKQVIDELGQVHRVAVFRYYCHNVACRYQSFTHLPPGLVPHSPYPMQVRLLAV